VSEILRCSEDQQTEYFLVKNDDLDRWFVHCWNQTNGMMTMTIDDEPLAYAVVEYMKNNGYLQFDSNAEASAYAKARGWICSRDWPGKNTPPPT
jgi:hypothetical protein